MKLYHLIEKQKDKRMRVTVNPLSESEIRGMLLDNNSNEYSIEIIDIEPVSDAEKVYRWNNEIKQWYLVK